MTNKQIIRERPSARKQRNPFTVAINGIESEMRKGKDAIDSLLAANPNHADRHALMNLRGCFAVALELGALLICQMAEEKRERESEYTKREAWIAARESELRERMT